MKLFIKFLCVLFLGTQVMAQANNNCANATSLTSNAAQLCGQSITTASTVQAGEYLGSGTCAATVANINQSVWYRFVATSASMYVEFEVQSTTGAFWCPNQLAMTVFNSSTCFPGAGQVIMCESYGALDGAITIDATGLVIGNSYLVQVSNFYNGSGNPRCQLQIPDFCIRVGDNTPPCTCSNICTNGCGFAVTPTVPLVVSTCPIFNLNPISDGTDAKSYCYDFIAVSPIVSFGMIITSNCGAGNVSGFSWTLQGSGCGANIASGTLAGLSVAGLTIGARYVLCYTYTVPSSCHHSSLYPFFVGASPLPVQMEGLNGYNEGDRNVIKWNTISEVNSDYFIIEKSINGTDFSEIATIDGAGNSEESLIYTIYDTEFRNILNYYRLIQVDQDGNRTTSKIITINNSLGAPKIVKLVNLLGQEVSRDYEGIVIEMYSDGTQRKIFN